MLSNANINRAILVGVVAIFLTMLGSGISQKARHAVAPPIYDPIGYYAKSELVWKAISKHEYLGAMNWFPYRPPGTALILYPCGFKPSIPSFLFRSVFAAVAIWSLALTILLLPLVRSRSDMILGSGLIAGLMSLPIFYHFQNTDFFSAVYRVGNEWGLVDPLQGTVAALGVGLIVLGISRQSLALCLGGWFAGAYTLLIKPSGILVMGALLGMAIIELFLRYCSEPKERRTILKSGVLMLAGGGLVYGLTLYLAFSTDYMGKDAVTKGIIAQKIDITLHASSLFPKLYLLIQPVIGWWFFVPLLVILIGLIIETIYFLRRQQVPAAGLRLAVCAAIAGATLWWWVNLAGMEHRFLFPILLMLIAWITPDIFNYLERLLPIAKKWATAYCLIPCILLTGMLHTGQPDTRLQKIMGVNLTNDQYKDEVIQGKWLDDQSKALKRPLRVYCMGDGIRVGVVEMIDWVNSIEHGNKPPHLIICRPNTWIAHPGLKIQELIESDFILMEKVEPVAASIGVIKISDWRDEPGYFKQFAYLGCGPDKNGLEVAFDGGIKILRVVDAHKFADTIHTWTQSIQWENDFSERNKNFLDKYK